jgi:hypothetical protein
MYLVHDEEGGANFYAFHRYIAQWYTMITKYAGDL